MNILAFETSCDDTAVAIVKNGCEVLGSVCLSQVEHSQWGGVVPEIAARAHAENWPSALEQCLAEADLSFEEVDALAVTRGPGLQTSLLTGTTAVSFLSLLEGKPLIPVHHILGHVCSVFLGRDPQQIQFPSLVLTVSGGHTQMHLWRAPTELELLGHTLDDAAGEAFDKVAAGLGLGYPGGPIVSARAETGDRGKHEFPRSYLAKDSLDFSFSGLKAAVQRLIDEQEVDDGFMADVCASFEATVGDVFVKKVSRALERHPEVQQVHFVGGVSANTYLRERLTEFLSGYGLKLFTPTKRIFSTDNAAMIGAAAYFLYQKNPQIAEVRYVESEPRLGL